MTPNELTQIILNSLLSNEEFLVIWNNLEIDRKIEIVDNSIQKLSKHFEENEK